MDLNEIIISEIKKDRERLVGAIEKAHCYGFGDVEEETPIVLSQDWNSVKLDDKEIEAWAIKFLIAADQYYDDYQMRKIIPVINDFYEECRVFQK